MRDDSNRPMFNIAKTLHKKKNREQSGMFLIEGQREIELARRHGVEIVYTFDNSNTSAKDLERISYCGQIIAIAKSNSLCFAKPLQERSGVLEYSLYNEEPLIVILDNMEKPGNIGAIIRTAEAAGVSAVFVCDGANDLTNPNLIRASLGAVFSMPVISTAADIAAQHLKEHNIPVVTASPYATKKYFEYNYCGATAIVIGSEADGVSDFWQEQASESVTIPMTGEVNSLNASVSAAILIYEAVRNRHKTDTSRV